MNPKDSAPQLRVDAELTLTIDGRPAYLHGHGTHLRVDVDGPALLFDALSTEAIPVRDVAELLAAHGLTVEIGDRYGPLLVVGHDADPGVSAMLTGSRYVTPAGLSGALRLALGFGAHRLAVLRGKTA